MTIKYMGSKKRIIKMLLPFLLEGTDKDTIYIEPFVGGCNSIAQIPLKKRIGYDINPYLVNLWQCISKDGPEGLNDNVTEAEYQFVKDLYIETEDNPLHLDPKELAYIGWVGFSSSFGSKFWGGYARGKDAKGNPRNYAAEVKRSVVKNYDKIKGIDFRYGSYEQISIPTKGNVVIYCDPPYEGTTKYKTDGFDHRAFWQWIRDNTSDRVKIYVSEYNAPEDFTCLWSHSLKSSLAKHDHKANIEKLFTYEKQ